MMDHREPPNWVKGYADCNLDATFEALRQFGAMSNNSTTSMRVVKVGLPCLDENTDGWPVFSSEIRCRYGRRPRGQVFA